jgi:soluble lytic murein transglycosylase-like protein
MKKFKKIGLVFALFLTTVSTMVPRDGLYSKIIAVLEYEGTGLSTSAKEEIADTVLKLSKTYQMDPMLILAVMKVESQFNIRALSNRDARGLMQVRPIVVRAVAADLGIKPNESAALLTDHNFNIRVGVHYLSSLVKQFRGDIKKALMAYNMGPTAVARLYKNRPVPDGGYQGKVLKVYWSYSNS